MVEGGNPMLQALARRENMIYDVLIGDGPRARDARNDQDEPPRAIMKASLNGLPASKASASTHFTALPGIGQAAEPVTNYLIPNRTYGKY